MINNKKKSTKQTYTGKIETASFLRRAGALFYDCFVLFSFWILATAIALWINKGQSFLPHQALFLAYLFLVTGLFLSYFWHKKGQTLGMLAWKIAVVDHNNAPLSWRHAWIRYVFGCLSCCLGGLGFLWCLFDKEKKSLHDKLANTKVIYFSS